ncbi:MAG: SagB/ThcOx family dehydrogenase [Deltaproteobacteria bacterium]|nr:SagB/ThcOx family dehydrogenase [Deltaproteobacteria bacterium]
MSDSDPRRTIVAYHQRTKHHPYRYARSLGYMDWDTQPDPFRRYDGAPRVALARPEPGPLPLYDEIFDPGMVRVRAVDGAGVAQLFYDSLAISAWKAYGDARWALRCNPSSGNLHPTEGYLICGAMGGVGDAPAVYHYGPFDHALERRSALADDEWRALSGQLPPGAILLGLSSIYWRESWKYGERAFRYCQHDVGHAIGAVAVAAAALGWEARLLEGVTDDVLAALLGIADQTGPEAEHPDGLIAVFPQGAEFTKGQWKAFRIPEAVVESRRAATYIGEPNALSSDHVEWEVIDAAHRATVKSVAPEDAYWYGTVGGVLPEYPPSPMPARQVIRQRRSAVDMDGATSISRDVFYKMMLKATPDCSHVPHAALPWRPAIVFAVFVHRVRELASGLYMLVRDSDQRERLKAATHDSFAWTVAPGCPEGLSLFLLKEGDMRSAAAGVSCGQGIASDGAFAVAMLGDFEATLAEHGAWFYKRLHWEAGLAGQVLYLEAEAAGVRATGIGCFFDDATHDMLGLRDGQYQSIYHFTVGGPVEDERLQTIAAYEHLNAE